MGTLYSVYLGYVLSNSQFFIDLLSYMVVFITALKLYFFKKIKIKVVKQQLRHSLDASPKIHNFTASKWNAVGHRLNIWWAQMTVLSRRRLDFCSLCTLRRTMQSLNENKGTMISGARKKKPLLSFTIEEKTKNVKAISI